MFYPIRHAFMVRCEPEGRASNHARRKWRSRECALHTRCAWFEARRFSRRAPHDEGVGALESLITPRRWPSVARPPRPVTPRERRRDRVVDRLEPDELELSSRVLGDVLEVLAVPRRQHDARQPGAAAAAIFSLMPPIGSTRPRRLISPVIAVSLPDRPVGQQRDQRHGHRDAGARPVLRDARRPARGCGCRSSRTAPDRCRARRRGS